MSQAIIAGHHLGIKLAKLGCLPEECADLEILIPVRGPLSFRFLINITQDQLHILAGGFGEFPSVGFVEHLVLSGVLPKGATDVELLTEDEAPLRLRYTVPIAVEQLPLVAQAFMTLGATI